VGRTNTSELSRMTIVVIGSTEQKDQIIKQLASLV
jgi:acetolactate synthase small subunit